MSYLCHTNGIIHKFYLNIIYNCSNKSSSLIVRLKSLSVEKIELEEASTKSLSSE